LTARHVLKASSFAIWRHAERRTDVALWTLEINDRAVTVRCDARLIDASPGVAVVATDDISTGLAARPWLQPLRAFDRFWAELNETPVSSVNAAVRHHADLAYLHLGDILARTGKLDELVVAVPGHYGQAEFSLLTGICAARGLRVSGLVDASVAALAACAPGGQYTVVEMHNQQTNLVGVGVGTHVERSAVEVCDYSGWRALEQGFLDAAAAAFLEQCRFDPLEQPASEHELLRQLTAWQHASDHPRDLQLTLDLAGRPQRARLPAATLAQATRRTLASLRERIPVGSHVMLPAGLAALPGITSVFPDASTLPDPAVAQGISTHLLDIASSSGSPRFHPVLSAARDPSLEITTRAPDAAGSHLLDGAVAYRVDHRPVYLFDHGCSRTTTPDAPGVNRSETAVELHPHQSAVAVNGVPLRGATTLSTGDRITLASGRTFVLIDVQDDA